ncbi:MAG: rod-binding protein [Pseudomonadota bacterium]
MDIDIVNQNLSKANLDKVKTKTMDSAKDKELKDACAGFEAIFINTMIKSMRQSLPGNALFKDSNATKIYQSMQDQSMAEKLSQGETSIGLKDYLYENLKK